MLSKNNSLFIFFHSLIFFIFLGFFGFSASIPLAVVFSIGIVVFLKKYYGVFNAVSMAIIYLLIFDSEIYYFTSFNIRLWYPLLIFNLCYMFFSYLKHNKRVLIGAFNFYVFLYFFAFSFAFLVLDTLFIKVHIIKYWVFSIGLIVVLTRTMLSIGWGERRFFQYLLSLAIIVGIWGGWQYISVFILGMDNNFKAPIGNNEFRPAGFFSETTWFGEYMAFSLILVLFMKAEFNSFSIFIFILFMFGVVISITRNAYLVIMLIATIELFYYLLQKKIKPLHLCFFILMCLITPLAFEFLEPLSIIVSRFENTFSTENSRYQALLFSFDAASQSWLLGNGFFWDLSMVTSEGTAYGAKSFNLFLMIYHIFGLLGLLLFLSLIFSFVIKLFVSSLSKKTSVSNANKYSLIYFVSFIFVSMFAPLHQFPIGMYFISLAIFLSSTNENQYDMK